MMLNVLPNPVGVSGGQLPVGSQPHSFRVCPPMKGVGFQGNQVN